jgi:hypothetical protein
LKYSFDFTIDGEACQTWCDPENNRVCFDCGNLAEFLNQLTLKIDRAIKQCESKSEIDILDVRKFALKHIEAMIRVEKELQGAPDSERHFELLNSKPVDVEKLSDEERCMFEVLEEQLEKAESDGAVGEGVVGDRVYTITKEMVEAKMREKKQH